MSTSSVSSRSRTLDVGVLKRLHVAIDPSALLGCGRLAETFLPDPGFLHTGARPRQGTVHRYDGSAEDFRCLGRGEAEHVTQDQRTTLTRRQVLQGGGERQAQAAAVDHALAGSPVSSNESGKGWSQAAFSRTSGSSGSDAATSPDGSGRRPRTSKAVRQAFVAIR